MSLPSRERGLKSNVQLGYSHAAKVAPFTGAWIEIHTDDDRADIFDVAPFTGAWIEILRAAG